MKSFLGIISVSATFLNLQRATGRNILVLEQWCEMSQLTDIRMPLRLSEAY